MKRKVVLLLVALVLLTSCSRRVGNVVANTFTGLTINYQLLGWRKGKSYNLYPVYLRSKVNGTVLDANDYVKVTLQIHIHNPNRQNFRIYLNQKLSDDTAGVRKVYTGNDLHYDEAFIVPYTYRETVTSYLRVYTKRSPYPLFISPRVIVQG